MGKRDFYAGGLMFLLGLGIALKGATYRPAPSCIWDRVSCRPRSA